MATAPTSIETLPLESGDRLTRAEFERRYACHPEIKKAELIEGVVYVGSPVSTRHSSPHGALMTWLGVYQAHTPGTLIGDNGTLRLDANSEPQPDAYLAWDADHGGQSRVDEDDYLEGAPELVAEIAASSAAYDLHDKMEVYRRNGVQEYIVWQVLEERIDWFRLRQERYVPLEPDANGITQSEVFPGLRLNIAKMLAGDLKAVLAGLEPSRQ